MDEEHAEYNILLTVQRHTFDDFYRKICQPLCPRNVILYVGAFIYRIRRPTHQRAINQRRHADCQITFKKVQVGKDNSNSSIIQTRL